MAYQGHYAMNRGPGLMPAPPGGMYPPPHQPPSYPQPPQMMMGMPPMGQHMPPGMMPPPGVPPHMPPPPGMPHSMLIGASMTAADPVVKVPIPASTANMKVATTVFVGNISEKASDTLIRQILLRCGPIDGWKRVQDATGKLQGFGFCEYADPDSTLRALRLLDKLKLGEKALVAKVDAKTRKELLKYLIMKKHAKNKMVTEAEVDKEVEKLEEDKDVATAALITEVSEGAKSEDDRIRASISAVLKDYLSILSSNKSNEDIQRERDVKESILFMAKQSGNLDPDSTLEDMDMEDEVKTLVSDEIKRFRESYKRSDEARKDKKYRDRDFKDRDRDKDAPEERDEDRPVKSKVKESEAASSDTPQSKVKSKRDRDRSRSPTRRDNRDRDSSPSTRRGRSPMRSRSQDRQDKEKRREAMRQREKEEVMKEEAEYEERMRARRIKDRERVYKQRLANWEGREYRKGKENEKETKREKERKEDMERERKHLGDFLAEYDDNKDDQKYYKGSAYARRRREREVEMESDDRDRVREKDELEELRLQVIERQAREILSGDPDRDGSGDDSPSRAEGDDEDDEEEDMDVPVKEEIEEDIPLTKSGYNVHPTYPPIQVQSAPSVENSSGGFVPVSVDPVPAPTASILLRGGNNSDLKQDHSEGNSPAACNSPNQAKLAFGLKKTPAPNPTQATLSTGQSKSAKMEKIFATEEEDVETKPKKKLVPIEYSDEEGEEEGDSRKKRSRRSSGSGRSSSSRRHHSSGSNDVGIVARGSGDVILLQEVPKDRKLTSEERKKMTQTLVNSIPTTKEEVFRYQLKWDQIDKALIEKRVDPWINKKIAEYIGEPEPILTEFICNKLSCHISPDDILNDISMVLDDEAEVFILKLWRLLIYETEAKHLGIAKSY